MWYNKLKKKVKGKNIGGLGQWKGECKQVGRDQSMRTQCQGKMENKQFWTLIIFYFNLFYYYYYCDYVYYYFKVIICLRVL